MRIGIHEIILILIIVIVVAIVARLVRSNPRSNSEETGPSRDIATVQTVDRKKKSYRIYTKRFGIASIIIGILLALSVMSIFKWAVQSYMWALILLILGIGLLLLSRINRGN